MATPTKGFNGLSAEAQLDTVLSCLDNDHTPETEDLIMERIPAPQPSIKNLVLVLDKLRKDGYVDFENGKRDGQIDPWIKLYFITYHGRVFLSEGGYKSRRNSQMVNKAYTVVKTIAIAANAAIITIIAFWTLVVSLRNSEQEGKNERAIKSIESRMDSLVRMNPKIQ